MMLSLIVWAALALLAILQVGDWWTTSRVIAAGGRERNPLEVWSIARFGSVDRALASKGLLVVLVGAVFAVACPAPAAILLLACVCAAFVYAVINNLLVMRKMGLLP